jgi:hypothetical protein
MKALSFYFHNFVTNQFINQSLEIFNQKEITDQERKYLKGLIQQKELRLAHNNSLVNDSSLTKIIDANTTIDSILSPKVSPSKLGINRYGSKIRINENNNSPSNQMSSKNLNYFGATNRGYRGSIIKLGKISPLSNRSRVQVNNFGSVI